MTGEGADRRMRRTMLELVGEHGYQAVTIESVLRGSGTNRAQFYAAFTGKQDCFEAAYIEALDELVERLLDPLGAQEPWGRRMRGALGELVDFVAEDPLVARGLLSGARASGDGLEKSRREALAVFEAAIDSVRTEREAQFAPPPITARFILGAVEASVIQYLADPDGRDFGSEIEDILYLAVDLYLGAEAARAEVSKFRSRGDGRAS